MSSVLALWIIVLALYIHPHVPPHTIGHWHYLMEKAPGFVK